MHKKQYDPPTIRDLHGAAQGLSRLQWMYKLDTEDVANGYILDSKLSKEMSAHDCFVMGVSLYNSSKFLEASEWFMQAVQRMDNIISEGEEDLMEIFPFASYVEVLEYLHVSLYYGGKYEIL